MYIMIDKEFPRSLWMGDYPPITACYSVQFGSHFLKKTVRINPDDSFTTMVRDYADETEVLVKGEESVCAVARPKIMGLKGRICGSAAPFIIGKEPLGSRDIDRTRRPFASINYCLDTTKEDLSKEGCGDSPSEQYPEFPCHEDFGDPCNEENAMEYLEKRPSYLKIHSCKKACVGVYPSCVQNKIVWFWPNSHHEYKDIASRKKPPYIPEIDDPSFTCSMMARDVPYGYEFLIENLMDPTHVPYAHHGIMKMSRPSTSDEKADREGGKAVDFRVGESGIHGFTTRWMDEDSDGVFVPPCIFTASINFDIPSSSSPEQKRLVLVFLCVPVSPGKSRVIIAEPRNFALWMDHVIPRWVFHMHHNLLLDSDLYLLHLEERKIRERGTINWHKACYVPTKADANVVAFRRWFNHYSGGHVHWTSKLINANHLPPTPPKLQLMDRYRSHTENCSSCSAACERLNTLELLLHAFSFVSLGIVAALKPSVLPMAVRRSMALASLLCFLAAKCLSHFIHKTFHFHDYDHAFR